MRAGQVSETAYERERNEAKEQREKEKERKLDW